MQRDWTNKVLEILEEKELFLAELVEAFAVVVLFPTEVEAVLEETITTSAAFTDVVLGFAADAEAADETMFKITASS